MKTMEVSVMRTWLVMALALALLGGTTFGEQNQRMKTLPNKGFYRLGESITIFQTAFTSGDMIVVKHPERDIVTNCALNFPPLAEARKQRDPLMKRVGKPVYRSAYEIGAYMLGENVTKSMSLKATVAGDGTLLCSYPADSKKMPRAMNRLKRLISEKYRMNLILSSGLAVEQIYPPKKDGDLLEFSRIKPRKGLVLGQARGNSMQSRVITAWHFIFVRGSIKLDGTYRIVKAFAFPDLSLTGKSRWPTLDEIASEGVDMKYTVEVRGLKTAKQYAEDEDISTQKSTPAMVFQWLIGVLVVLFSSLSAGIILIRTVCKDITIANKDIGEFLLSDEEKLMESGWKLVHADVFRAPANSILLCATLGFGLQLLLTALLGGIGGAMYPAHFLGLAFFIYVLNGSFSGYISARFYKAFGGERWKLNVALTHFFYPLILLVIMCIAEITLAATKNENGGLVHAGRIFSSLAIWIFIGFPVTFVGAYFGFTRAPLDHPVRTNLIPRQIPTQACNYKLIPRAVFFGGLVFLSFFIQLYFFNEELSHDWNKGHYILLVVASVLTTIVCAETGLVSTYRQLSGENYHWWWQSIISTGFSGVYVFGVLCVIWFNKFVSGPEVQVQGMGTDQIVNAVLFLCATLCFSICVAITNGFIGFIASWIFVRKLYSSLRVD